MSQALDEAHYQMFHCINTLIDRNDWNALNNLNIDKSVIHAFKQAKNKSRKQVIDLMQASGEYTFDQHTFVRRSYAEQENDRLIEKIVFYMSRGAPHCMLAQVMGITSNQWRAAKENCNSKGIPYKSRKGSFKKPDEHTASAIVNYRLVKCPTMGDYNRIALELDTDLATVWAARKHLHNPGN
jgi:hypothetical protein